MNYDRTLEDAGNVVALEHVNVRIPDQRLSTLFYVTGLGLTRDPYLVTGVTNMWVNAGRSQFHLPTGEPQVLRGRIGIVTPDREGLRRRLEAVRRPLEGTSFDFAESDGCLDVTCPWGNRFRCHEPAERFGRMTLGIAYVEFGVPENAAEGIGRFYDEIMGAPSTLEEAAVRIRVGNGQSLAFRETSGEIPEYDGHHVQVYVADFSGPYDRLSERGLISEESNRYQYRFRDIADPASGEVLFVLDHEIRSMTHPLFARPLVNRNPDQTNRAFGPEHETLPWTSPERF